MYICTFFLLFWNITQFTLFSCHLYYACNFFFLKKNISLFSFSSVYFLAWLFTNELYSSLTTNNLNTCILFCKKEYSFFSEYIPCVSKVEVRIHNSYTSNKDPQATFFLFSFKWNAKPVRNIVLPCHHAITKVAVSFFLITQQAVYIR